jgi:hypothetical protein
LPVKAFLGMECSLVISEGIDFLGGLISRCEGIILDAGVFVVGDVFEPS